MGMLSDLRRLLSYEMTLAEWLGTAVLLVTPHLVLGVVCAVLQPGYITSVDGAEKVAAAVGTVVFWPVLLIAELCP